LDLQATIRNCFIRYVTKIKDTGVYFFGQQDTQVRRGMLPPHLAHQNRTQTTGAIYAAKVWSGVTSSSYRHSQQDELKEENMSS
jgi:hypothetical protein